MLRPRGIELKIGEVSRSKANCGQVVGSRSSASGDSPRALDRRADLERARPGQLGRSLFHDSVATRTCLWSYVVNAYLR